MDNLRQLQRFSLFRTIAALAVAGWMLLAVGLVAPARAQEPVSMVVIHIQDVSPKGGVLRLGLYDEARYPDDDATPVASADVKAEMGDTVVTLTNVPPGSMPSRPFRTSTATTRWTPAGSVFRWNRSASRVMRNRVSPSRDFPR